MKELIWNPEKKHLRIPSETDTQEKEKNGALLNLRSETTRLKPSLTHDAEKYRPLQIRMEDVVE